MDEVENKNANPPSKKSSHVRFTDAELAQLERDAKVRGLSIPAMLKEAYFEGRPTTVLMTKEDQRQIMMELLRQGNNLNQLTRQVNAGILGGAKDEMSRLVRSMEGMLALLRGKVLKLRAAQ